jgi:mannosyltransferase OCH1-like enzyme
LIVYPIKYKRKNGTSIWVEREIIDFMLAYGFFIKKGSWVTIEKEVLDYLLEEHSINMKEKFQNVNEHSELIEKTPELKKAYLQFIYSYLKELL